MPTVIVCIATVALCWGGWPLVMRSAGVNNVLATLLLSVAAVFPVAVKTAVSYRDTMMPSTRTVLIILAAGTMMGIGLLAFNYVINTRAVDISKSVPATDASILLVTTAGGIVFFSEGVTPQKLFGFLFLLAGIILLRPAG